MEVVFTLLKSPAWGFGVLNAKPFTTDHNDTSPLRSK